MRAGTFLLLCASAAAMAPTRRILPGATRKIPLGISLDTPPSDYAEDLDAEDLRVETKHELSAADEADLHAGKFRCCAMWGKGDYYSNITVSGDTGGKKAKLDRGHGYIAANAATQQFAISLGSYDIEKAPLGYYAATCNARMQTYGVVWKDKQCKVYKYKKGSPVPNMCFGNDSYLPIFHSRVRLDALTHLLKFTDERNKQVAAINWLTCMPFWKYVVPYGKADDYIDAMTELMSPWEETNLRASPESIVDEDIRPVVPQNRMFIVYQNATAFPPPASAFGFPSWCKEAVEAFA